MMYPCSQGWQYITGLNEVHVTAGGEISARYVSPKPLGTDPLPIDEWPPRTSLTGRGWRQEPSSATPAILSPVFETETL